jgi:hypothetical protein
VGRPSIPAWGRKNFSPVGWDGHEKISSQLGLGVGTSSRNSIPRTTQAAGSEATNAGQLCLTAWAPQLSEERGFIYTLEVSYTFLNIFAGSRNSAYQRGIVVWGRNNSVKNYRGLVGGYGQ